MLGGRARVVLTGHADASSVDDLATQRSSQGYTFSLGSNSVSWRSTRSSSVLSSSCEAEIYVGAMAAQELRWLTYLLTDLGEAPRSPPVLYVDNKAMLALCQEHRLEHRTKHIFLRYFLARELQQRGQLRLAYMASQANTADVFTKALPPGLHLYQHQLGCLLFASVTCRPDLSYIDSQLAQYSRKPVAENHLDLERALQYFTSTPNIGLSYSTLTATSYNLDGYVDADHAADPANRRSRTGFVFHLEPTGPISWNSQNRELVALSSAEAEYIAATATVREGLYL
ncbi:unnamed protein product [Closterium sp. NIES-53]